MTQQPACPLANRDELARSFVADALRGPDKDAFEEHLLGCATCQGEVRLAFGIRDSVGARRPARRFLVPASLVLAAASVVLLVVPNRSPSVTDLGRVESPPVYLPVPVRGGPIMAMFEDGMRLYEQASWAGAADALRRAAAGGAPTDVAWFFAGASELFAGRPDSAAAAFARVIALGEGPYLPEARLYRAKALLRLGRSSEALAELRLVPAGTAVAGHARALGDSLAGRGVR